VKRRYFDFPVYSDTTSKPITRQPKKIYEAGGIIVDNLFDTARLNDFQQTGRNEFVAYIDPENFPVNNSPWYAFRLHSERERKIRLSLQYSRGTHRYPPAVIEGKTNRYLIDNVYPKLSSADFEITLQKDPLIIAAGEILDEAYTEARLNALKRSPFYIERMSIGKSALGRNLDFLRFGLPGSSARKVIVLTGRMHPPEVTGYLALHYFMEKLVENSPDGYAFFKQYEVWLFPVLNPDGVALGHWRHNANGVDLNRDWSRFRQPETDAVSRFIVDRVDAEYKEVALYLDFHSMDTETYFLLDDKVKTPFDFLRTEWLQAVDRQMFPFRTVHEATPETEAYAKVWFNRQFGAESIIYEVADNTPREIIRKKAFTAAELLKRILVK